MKNRKIYLIAILLLGVIAFYSCQKDETNSVKDILVGNIWQYDSLTVSDVNDVGLVLTASFMHMGYAGGEFNFKSDGTYTLSSDLINENGTWELIDDKTLVMDDDDEMEILTISDSHLEFKVIMEGTFLTIPFSGYAILKFDAK